MSRDIVYILNTRDTTWCKHYKHSQREGRAKKKKREGGERERDLKLKGVTYRGVDN